MHEEWIGQERAKLAQLLVAEGWQPKPGQACRDPENRRVWRRVENGWVLIEPVTFGMFHVGDVYLNGPHCPPNDSSSIVRALSAGPDLSDAVTVDSLLLCRDYEIKQDTENGPCFDGVHDAATFWWSCTVWEPEAAQGAMSDHEDRACAIATAHLGELRRAAERAGEGKGNG